jgi:hypothetical protein
VLGVADLGEKQHVFRRRCGLGGTGGLFLLQRLAHAVHALDHQEDDPGEDEEVDEHGDEIAVGKDRALLAGGGKRRCRHVAGQRDEVVGKIETTPGQCTDDRHDQVVDDGFDDLVEGCTDDDTHGEVHDIAAGDKRLELIEHEGLLLLRSKGNLV